MAKKRAIFYTLGDYEVGRRPPVPSKAEEDDEVMHGRMNPKAAKKRATLSSLQAVAKKFKATKPKRRRPGESWLQEG